MMNMLPTTEKGSRFVGICMHMCTPVVLRMYASPSTAFELGDAEFLLSSKKKTEKGLCYVGIGGRQLGGTSFCFNLVLISSYMSL